MPYYNGCLSTCENNFRNVGKLPRCHIRHIVYFLFLQQATRPSPLLDWEMANCIFAQLTNSNVLGKLPIRDSNNRINWKLLLVDLTIIQYTPDVEGPYL
jgi:hypothetical protein